MTASRLLALCAAILMGLMIQPARSDDRAQVDVLIQYYADYYDLPVELVRRVVKRESTFNPAARNGPYWGLMQIRHDTAQSMGYRGSAEGLLDAETNLIYAVKYLRGAYLVARGNQDAAVRNYAAGYYYKARDMGLLEETGLRPGPKSPVAPTPPALRTAQTPQPAPQKLPQLASVAPAAVGLPQGMVPPERPRHLLSPAAAVAEATTAVQAVAAVAPAPVAGDTANGLRPSVTSSSAYFETVSEAAKRIETDFIEATFSMFEKFSSPFQSAGQ
ncbi:transglycosylase SLT domain-containing protein [Pelagibacterium montanilacus]|uniref:transglycosylase SLT domain-containing protein n=1 Tax=Pelagibacterium montanilacus TaxID=2185280 RepID=UPI003CCC6495